MFSQITLKKNAYLFEEKINKGFDNTLSLRNVKENMYVYLERNICNVWKVTKHLGESEKTFFL